VGHDRQTGDKMTDRLAVTVAQTFTPQGDRGKGYTSNQGDNTVSRHGDKDVKVKSMKNMDSRTFGSAAQACTMYVCLVLRTYGVVLIS